MFPGIVPFWIIGWFAIAPSTKGCGELLENVSEDSKENCICLTAGSMLCQWSSGKHHQLTEQLHVIATSRPSERMTGNLTGYLLRAQRSALSTQLYSDSIVLTSIALVDPPSMTEQLKRKRRLQRECCAKHKRVEQLSVICSYACCLKFVI